MQCRWKTRFERVGVDGRDKKRDAGFGQRHAVGLLEFHFDFAGAARFQHDRRDRCRLIFAHAHGAADDGAVAGGLCDAGVNARRNPIGVPLAVLRDFGRAPLVQRALI